MQTLSAQCHKAAEMMAKSTAEQDNESETTAERDIDSDFLSQSSYVDEDDDAGDAEIDDEITAITASMVHCNHHHQHNSLEMIVNILCFGVLLFTVVVQQRLGRC